MKDEKYSRIYSFHQAPAFNNLTEIDFTSDKKSLSLGLKHIPAPDDNSRKELNDNLIRFRDRIYWRYKQVLGYFDNSDEDDNYNPKLRKNKPSSYDPRDIEDLEDFETSIDEIDYTLTEIFDSVPRTKRNQDFTFNKLVKRYPLLKFVAADKNLGLTILTLEQYNNLVDLHLQDENIYQKFDAAPNDMNFKRIYEQARRLWVKNKASTLTRRERDWLVWKQGFKEYVPHFHVLPKLHKKGPLTGRPIVGATNWITTSHSIMIDIKLQKELQDKKTYPCILKNTGELIEAIKELKSSERWKFNSVSDTDPQDPSKIERVYLITMDIVSLYTNIDLTLLYDDMDTVGLKSETQFICENNFMQYAGKLYRQRQGIAMGTNAAVNMANFYLARRLDSFFQLFANLLYKRYIDDIFLIHKCSEEDLDMIHKLANKLIPGIRLTMEYSTESVNFLDLTVCLDYLKSNSRKKSNILVPQYSIDITYTTFQKTMSKYIYITPLSTHHPSMLRGFIIGELTRYRRTNSSQSTFNSVRRLFKQRLLNRQYSNRMVNRYFSYEQSLFDAKQNAEHINGPPPVTLPVVPFVLRYTNTPLNASLSHAILKILKDPSFFQTIRETTDIRRVFSTAPNAGSILLRSFLTEEQIKALPNKRGLDL